MVIIINNINEENPLLSIIIPTRNRQKYAISTINDILSISNSNIELVIQDNSDNKELEKYLNIEFNDSRLVYNHINKPLSFIDNFEIAVSMASGRYICIIGDDDGINPEIIEATQWAEINNIDALKPTISVFYTWPESGATSILKKDISNIGILEIRNFSGELKLCNSMDEIKKVIKNGGTNYLDTDLPRLYHGVVKRKCIDQIKNNTGYYFGGLSPDIYIAIALANYAKKIVSIDYPLTIAGACKPSGSMQSQRGEHVGKLEDAPHFNYRGNYQWSEIIPRFYSVQTIWADSTIAALKAIKREDLLHDFNISYLSAQCIANHTNYAPLIIRDMIKAFHIINKNIITGIFLFFYYLFVAYIIKINYIIKNALKLMLKNNNTYRTYGVNTIAEVLQIFNRKYKNKMTFKEIISKNKSI